MTTAAAHAAAHAAAPDKLCIAIVAKSGSDEVRTPLLTSLINMQFALATLNVQADLKVVDSLETAMRESRGAHLLAVETDIGFDPRFVLHAMHAPHDVVLLPYPVGIDWGALTPPAAVAAAPEPGTAMLRCMRYSAEPACMPADGAHYVEALPGAETACVFVREGAQTEGGVARLWARPKPPVIDLKFNAVKAVRMAFAGCVGNRAVLR
jgi:hypothetical protein